MFINRPKNNVCVNYRYTNVGNHFLTCPVLIYLMKDDDNVNTENFNILYNIILILILYNK